MEKQTEERKYAYKEAYCLMTYKDEKTGVIELLWNSRDGITSFLVTSREGNTSSHINFDSDICDPTHVPDVGTRIFVDLTYEMALESRRKYVEKLWDDVGYPMKERYGHLGKEKTAKKFASLDWLDWGGHGPTVIEVTEEIREMFAAKDY